MTAYVPITGAPLRAPSFPFDLIGHVRPRFVLANREAIENEIERLIALLDMVDGDCDIEDDDPGGDYLDNGEAPTDDGEELLPDLPIYGLDQSLGPINEREAVLARYRRVEDNCGRRVLV